jgi:hypothetical protein
LIEPVAPKVKSLVSFVLTLIFATMFALLFAAFRRVGTCSKASAPRKLAL